MKKPKSTKRKLNRSTSSSSSLDGKSAKRKRVSFSNALEETRFIDEHLKGSTTKVQQAKELTQEGLLTPRKGILKTTPKKASPPKKKITRKLTKTNSKNGNLSPNNKEAEAKVSSAEDQQTSDEIKPEITPQKSNLTKANVGNTSSLMKTAKTYPKLNRRSKTIYKKKILVRKSTKEMLMNMNKRERREFIRQLEERNKPNFELTKQAKLLWEKIRSSKTPNDVKEEQIQKLLGLCSGKLATMIHSHVSSRVIQALLKLKRPEIRQAIFDELEPEIIRMAKSKHAKFFVAKMLKYGSKEQRDRVISALKGHFVRLYNIAHSADLVNAIYGEWAIASQYHAMIYEFYGPEFHLFQDEFIGKSNHHGLANIAAKYPEKMPQIIKHLESILEKAVKKIPVLKLSITHRLLVDYLDFCTDEQKQSLIEELRDHLPEICHTKEGSRAALMCIWAANAKDRKAIVKSFKGLVIRTCQDNCARRALFGIFDTVDDTVFVNKIITQEIADNIADIIYHKDGVWVLHYLVHPRDYRVFGKGMVEMLRKGDSNPHSKKEAAQRYMELFECLKPALMDFMKANMREMITNKISSVLVLDTLEVPKLTDPFQRSIPVEDLQTCFQAIAEIAADEFIPHSVDGPSHIVQGGCARFVFRKLLMDDPNREEGTKLSDFLADIPPESLSSWTGMDCGCFALVEVLKSGSNKARMALIDALNGGSLKKSGLKGAAKLLEELEEQKLSIHH